MRNKNILLSVISLFLAGGLLAADTYTLDAAHATVGFSVRHLGISNVKGSFPKVEGTLRLDGKNMAKSSVEITIDAASVNTNNDKRDEHLRGTDFFDVGKFPTSTFKSTSVSKNGAGYLVTGDLTMKGVTKSVAIPFTLSGPVDHPMMPVSAVGAAGSVTINRRDFNILYGPAALISDEVVIDLQVEFTRPLPKK
ncbi:MAG: YceI family protein [Elusimicrobia bacterium]|nr:YceI family protein [Elusimicrobiota bacterium]